MSDGDPVQGKVSEGSRLVAVIGQDAVVGQLESPTKLGADRLQGRGDVADRHPQGDRGYPIESLREVPDSGIAAHTDLVEDGPDRSRRKRLLG
jgi:hypothetical protein